MIRRLKSKNSSLSETRAAIAAHSRTMLSKALGSKRQNINQSTIHSDSKKQSSDTSRRMSVSFSVEEGDLTERPKRLPEA